MALSLSLGKQGSYFFEGLRIVVGNPHTSMALFSPVEIQELLDGDSSICEFVSAHESKSFLAASNHRLLVSEVKTQNIKQLVVIVGR